MFDKIKEEIEEFNKILNFEIEYIDDKLEIKDKLFTLYPNLELFVKFEPERIPQIGLRIYEKLDSAYIEKSNLTFYISRKKELSNLRKELIFIKSDLNNLINNPNTPKEDKLLSEKKLIKIEQDLIKIKEEEIIIDALRKLSLRVDIYLTNFKISKKIF